MKGSYLLLIELKKDREISVGKLGKILFNKGFYAYVGSALNGLEQRIQRHIRNEKKIHWHIDYLLRRCDIKETYYKEGIDREECKISQNFEKYFSSISGFGCSDCKCDSHLYYGSINDFRRIVDEMNFEKY